MVESFLDVEYGICTNFQAIFAPLKVIYRKEIDVFALHTLFDYYMSFGESESRRRERISSAKASFCRGKAMLFIAIGNRSKPLVLLQWCLSSAAVIGCMHDAKYYRAGLQRL
jgi:hypothetical protein